MLQCRSLIHAGRVGCCSGSPRLGHLCRVTASSNPGGMVNAAVPFSRLNVPLQQNLCLGRQLEQKYQCQLGLEERSGAFDQSQFRLLFRFRAPP